MHPDRSKRPGHKARRGRGRIQPRRLLLIIAAVAALSLFQFLQQGRITWPGDLLATVTATLGGYADRPEAGWRQAAEQLDRFGAIREGTVPAEFDISGRVVRVADGDTVSILDRQRKQHKVRLFGIDTPERDQPYGLQAAGVLQQLVDDREVGVIVVTTDDYGRNVGTVYLGDINVNLAMVAGGSAWWYRYYAPHDRALQSAETKAREQGLGLWAGDDPIPPWDWRRGRR
ncbi:MAG: thermonuclease family protein [Pseudomonadota bacterium]